MKSKALKISWIVLATLGTDIAIHKLAAPSPRYDYPPSGIVTAGWFLPAIVAMLLLIYLALAILFLAIQGRLPGTKLRKGIVFGASFGGLMLVSSPAMCLLFGSSLREELRGAAVDAVALLILGLLLGRFTAEDGREPDRVPIGRALLSIWTIGPVYFALETLSYFLVPASFPAIRGEPAATLLWTLCVGLWIALMDLALGESSGSKSSIRQAAWFSFIVYGVFALFNALVAPIFVAAPLSMLLLGAFFGVASVCLAVLAARTGNRLLDRYKGTTHA